MRFSLRDVLASAAEIIERAGSDDYEKRKAGGNDSGAGSSSAAAADTTMAEGLLNAVSILNYLRRFLLISNSHLS
jgi:hypothetical protein